MARFKMSERWIETGYDVFAHKGPEHVQIEKMARVLGLNKSGFYHYFGTLEIYFEQLALHHLSKIDSLVHDIQNCPNIDPDFLNTLIKHKVTLMAQVHLTRNKNNAIFYSASEASNVKMEDAILPIWAEHIGLLNNYGLASRYSRFVRDIFYTRITFENFNYTFLHELTTEAKGIVEDMTRENISFKNLTISRQS